jgi:hypothetical protein
MPISDCFLVIKIIYFSLARGIGSDILIGIVLLHFEFWGEGVTMAALSL